MSIYLGTQLLSGVATNTISNAHDLFDFKWTDHELTDQSWLNADTFSWQDGEVYSDAFNHLVADYNNGELHTETVGSYTIDYILAPDGHKIVTQYNEATVANIYNESGVAWYYILDTANQRFKLPRTKYGFVGLRDEVGKYVPESLPNHNHTSERLAGINIAVSWSNGDILVKKDGYSNKTVSTTSIDNPTYQDNAPVQQRATQMYLYFYVGQFSQTATEQTAGLNSELFNGKVDLNAANLSAQGKSLISGLGMPSDNYEDLTLGASGSEYTAPANGYFFIEKVAGATGKFLTIINKVSGIGMGYCPNAGGEYARVFVPVKKGDVVQYAYNVTGATKCFRFIYAEGEPNV